MKHDVHVYTVVRVKVCNVEAKDHKEAMQMATDSVDFFSLLTEHRPRQLFVHSPVMEPERNEMRIELFEPANAVVGYTVDESGDAGFTGSRFYGPDMEPDKERS